MGDTPDLLTIAEAAERLRRSPRTITRWIASGALKGVRVGPATYVRSAEVATLTDAWEQGAALASTTVASLSRAQIEMLRVALNGALDALERETTV